MLGLVPSLAHHWRPTNGHRHFRGDSRIALGGDAAPSLRLGRHQTIYLSPHPVNV